jgi:hypothetical protein
MEDFGYRINYYRRNSSEEILEKEHPLPFSSSGYPNQRGSTLPCRDHTYLAGLTPFPV